jgi:hypothetical protein
MPHILYSGHGSKLKILKNDTLLKQCRDSESINQCLHRM